MAHQNSLNWITFEVDLPMFMIGQRRLQNQVIVIQKLAEPQLFHLLVMVKSLLLRMEKKWVHLHLTNQDLQQLK